MGRRLDVDSGVLTGMGRDLRTVATELDGAQTGADWIAAAVGDERLAGSVRELASSWDDRRADMLETIAALSQAATDAGDTFENLDSELAASLTGLL